MEGSWAGHGNGNRLKIKHEKGGHADFQASLQENFMG